MIQSSALGDKENTIKYMNLIDMPTADCIKICFTYAFRNGRIDLCEYLFSLVYDENFWDFEKSFINESISNKISSENLLFMCQELYHKKFPNLNRYKYYIHAFSVRKFYQRRDFDKFISVIEMMPKKKSMECLTMYCNDTSGSFPAEEIKSKIRAYLRNLHIDSIL